MSWSKGEGLAEERERERRWGGGRDSVWSIGLRKISQQSCFNREKLENFVKEIKELDIKF